MKKTWKKIGESQYQLYDESAAMGSLTLQLYSASGKAVATLGTDTYEIATSGFWKSTLIIKDSSQNEILKVRPAKWYGTRYDVLHENKRYRLEIQNNPLASWMLLDQNEVICSYGLETADGKVAIKISGSENVPLLFHHLLWYLFLPIATEQTGDDFRF